ncbi:MAG: hypothetical protein CVU80_00385 [Elusimicrobia bacterium HGW-Elusimicrobia-4]|nr:MAG: hypothetical protein CVU80_00385 [Elusimicrobia bacterium HGW-Elusimicrobia-4]
MFLGLRNVQGVEKGTKFYVPGPMCAAFYSTSEENRELIGNVYVKKPVVVIEEKGNMYRIVVDGWVKKNTLNIEKDDHLGVEYAKTKKEIELLEEPILLIGMGSLLGSKYANVNGNSKVTILEKKVDWVKIRTYGWVDKGILSNEIPDLQVNKKQPREIEMIKWDWTDLEGSILINGVVRNNSNKTFNYLKLKFEAKNEDGTSLGTGDTYINRTEFNPGEQSSFRVDIDGAIPKTNTIKISYELDDKFRE